MQKVNESKKKNLNSKLESNIKRYQNDYLKEESKAGPLRMKIHLKQ